MKSRLAAAAISLLALVYSPVPAGARSACEDVSIKAYRVRIRPEAREYRFGDIARTSVRVHRLDTDQPAGNVRVGIAMFQKGRASEFVGYGFNETDAQGETKVLLKLPRKYLRPGYVTLWAYAYRRVVDAVCATVTEYGFKKKARAFRVGP